MKKLSKFHQHIKSYEFDLVFDFSLNSMIGLFSLLAGIPHRVGFDYKKRGRFLTFKIPFNGFRSQHVINYYFDALEYMGLEVLDKSLKYAVPQEYVQWSQDFLRSKGFDFQEKLIGIMPGAGISWGKMACYRRWDVENYVKLVDKIIENRLGKVILMGDASEKMLCDKSSANHQKGLIDASGQTNLLQLTALLQQCSFVILNDGGPGHIAVAVGTMTLTFFGPVDEKIYGPYSFGHQNVALKSDICCRPCYRQFRMSHCEHGNCLKNITVDQVFEKVKKIL